MVFNSLVLSKYLSFSITFSLFFINLFCYLQLPTHSPLLPLLPPLRLLNRQHPE